MYLTLQQLRFNLLGSLITVYDKTKFCSVIVIVYRIKINDFYVKKNPITFRFFAHASDSGILAILVFVFFLKFHG